ncbi:MAG: hypothetical protein NXI24_11620 [bacterium]|nr:hypothetical protein [bacterium]
MSAGAPTPDPELDLLIAEHVMGWVRNRHGRLWPDRQCFGYRNSRGHGFVPAYSSDPGAALQVIEVLAAKPHNTRLECLSNRDGEYSCTLVKPGRKKSEQLLYAAHAPWPALAICLATLKLFDISRPAPAEPEQDEVAPAARKPRGQATAGSRKKAAKKAAKKSARKSAVKKKRSAS